MTADSWGWRDWQLVIGSCGRHCCRRPGIWGGEMTWCLEAQRGMQCSEHLVLCLCLTIALEIKTNSLALGMTHPFVWYLGPCITLTASQCGWQLSAGYWQIVLLITCGISTQFNSACSNVGTPVQVMGQTADLLDLQRILLRSRNKLSNQQQQNATRWAVFTAASLLRQVRALQGPSTSFIGNLPAEVALLLHVLMQQPAHLI